MAKLPTAGSYLPIGQPHQLLHRVDRHLRAGEANQAAALAEELVRRFPDFAAGYHYLGWLWAEAYQDHQRAMAAFEEALNRDAAYAPAYLGWLRAANECGRFDPIPEVASQALEVPGIDAGRIHHQLGLCYEQQRRWPEALAQYREAMLHTLDNQDLAAYRGARERCLEKMDLLAQP